MNSDPYPKVKFRNLLTESVRNGIYKQKEFHGRGCKIINMGELFSHPRLYDVPMKRVEINEKEAAKSLVQVGDLIFARRSLVASGAGKCSIIKKIDEPTTFESSIIRARPDPLLASSDYLYYYFSSPIGRERMGTILRQVAVSGITGSDLMDLEIECPPLDVQRKIANVLSLLDDRIDLLRETNATLEAICQSLFKSWFVDFDPVRAKQEGRATEGMDEATAALFPGNLQRSDLGLVPMEWQIARLDEMATVLMGLSPTGDSYNNDGNGVPLINGPVEFGEYFPVKSKWTQAATRFAIAHDLIFCVRGSTTGRRVIADDEYCIGRGVCAIRPRNSWNNFIYQTINAGLGRLLEKTTGSVFPSLSGPDIKAFKVLRPPEAVVAAFENTLAPLLEQVQGNHRTLKTLTDLRDALLPRLITGQLQTTESADKVASAA